MHQPTTGDRVRVTRYRPDGTTRFTKTGTILDVHQSGYTWREDGAGHRSLTGSQLLAEAMPGWTQTITPNKEEA